MRDVLGFVVCLLGTVFKAKNLDRKCVFGEERWVLRSDDQLRSQITILVQHRFVEVWIHKVGKSNIALARVVLSHIFSSHKFRSLTWPLYCWTDIAARNGIISWNDNSEFWIDIDNTCVVVEVLSVVIDRGSLAQVRKLDNISVGSGLHIQSSHIKVN